MTSTKPEDSWLRIPGYELYEINKDDLSVQKKCNGKIKKIRISNRKTVCLRSNGIGKTYTVTRLLFSAQHNIHPADLKQRDVAIIFENGKIEVVSRSSFNKRIKAGKKKRTPLETGEIINLYTEQLGVVKTIIDYYSNAANVSDIIHFLYGYKSKIVSFILSRKYSHNVENAEELFEMAIDTILDDIINRKIVLPYPLPYIQKTVRTLVVQRRKLMPYNEKSNIQY